MIRPQPFAFIAGSASRMVWNAAVRLSAMIRSHLSTGNSSIGATCWVPALLTRMSGPPKSARSARSSPRSLGLGQIGAVV